MGRTTRLMKEYATNFAWHIGRHEDIGYERYIVLDEKNLHEAKRRGIVMYFVQKKRK